MKIIVEQNNEVPDDNKCTLPYCHCQARVGGYCSPQCEAAEFANDHSERCHCPHDGCCEGLSYKPYAEAALSR